jgi:hypothetical protein
MYLLIGSSMPDKFKYFFDKLHNEKEDKSNNNEKKKYRCPSFLATSSNKKISLNFCLDAENRGLNPILWIIHLDPTYGCIHMNYVKKTQVPGEEEFLFVPYSTFEVESILFFSLS